MRDRWLKAFVVASVLVGLSVVSGFAQVSLISTGAVWRYLDNGTDQGTAWRAPGFLDDSWPSGPAELGFGDGDEATTNISGFITYYYRHAFDVADASSVTNLRAQLLRDDGAVVYLNGTEVFRSNMPTGEVFSTTVASGNADEGRIFYPANVSAGLLVDGNNVLAVEIHQSSSTSSDISFDFELTGNPLPLISITSPTNDQVIVAETVAISGTAIPGGPSVASVEVSANGSIIGSSTSAAFNIPWQNVTPGSYALEARVTDSLGLKATSAPVFITVRAPPATMVVVRGSVWKYNDSNTDLGTAWQAINYNDASWASGAAPLGGSDPGIVTTVNMGSSSARTPTIYFRRTVTVSNPGAYEGLILRWRRDDGVAIYLNGTFLHADGVTIPSTFSAYSTQVIGEDATYYETSVSSAALVAGANVFGVELKQCNATSSDLAFDLEVEGVVDVVAPTLVNVDPSVGAMLLELKFINVIFSENVTGVDVGDLLINGETATNLAVNTPRDYTFYFPQPATGVVQVAWALTTSITDVSPLANPFAGGSWSYTLDPNASTRPNLIISEFMAQNDNGIENDMGKRSDWIEIYNIGPLGANLNGWFLTDDKSDLTQWRFPNLTLDANKYLLVWASGENHTNPAAPLHTNFKLGAGGGYLGLVDPKTNVVSAFDPYPAQNPDISYGRDRVDPNLVGYFTTPTPGAQNALGGTGFAADPVFSVESGIYTNASITFSITTTNPTTIRYTVDGSVPTSSSPIYTAPITVSTNVFVKARAFSSNPTIWPSRVVAKTYFFLDNTTRDFNSNLPILIINTSGRSIPGNVPPGGTRARGSFAVIDTFRGRSSLQSQPDFMGMAEFEIYGQTSAGFPKLPYNIEIQDELGNDKAVSLLGMPAEADWKTRNPYTDKCLMNDFLTFELFEKMGHYSLRRRFVEVFVDSTGGGKLIYPTDYHGVEVLLERIERGKDRVDITELTPAATNEVDITGGYIWKKDKDSTGDLNFSTSGGGSFGGEGLKLHEPKPNDMRVAQGVTTSWPGAGYTPSASNQLRYLVSYLNRMETCLYATDWLTRTGTNHYSYYLDVDSFVDQHWIVEFPKQIDGYRLSNYMYKDRGGKVKMEPLWDWNLAFGNANYLKGGRTNGWYWNEQDEGMGYAEHIWLRRLLYGIPTVVNPGINDNPTSITNSGDPDFIQRMIDRWGELRTNVLYGPNVVARIDELAALLSEGAVRDFARFPRLGTYIWPNPNGAAGGWHVDYQNPTTYAGIISEMKKWTTGRYLWLDNQFVKGPTVNHPGGMIEPGFTLAMTAPLGTIYYTLDGTDPRAPGGGVSASARTFSSGITVTSNVLVFARARISSAIYPWSYPAVVPLTVSIPPLRITEMMYHPAAPPTGSPYLEDDFQYIEVKNIGASPLSLAGYRFINGLQFLFIGSSALVLSPGQTALLVHNQAAFTSRYGAVGNIAGAFTNNLSNAGERITLLGPLQEVVHDFVYDDAWYPSTDGVGFSLVVADENQDLVAWGLKSGWRFGGVYNGTPGQDEPSVAPIPPVLVNEALTHTDLPLTDAIELYNPNDFAVNVGGWYLSDDLREPKYRIPTGPAAEIAAGGYLVFYATNSFSASGGSTNPLGHTNRFDLRSVGDEVILFSADAAGNLTGYSHGFEFGAARNGVSFGRYLTSLGEEHFVAQVANTLGSANAGPKVGPIVISELMYRPPDVSTNNAMWDNTEDEFVELYSINNEAMSLWDPNARTNTWRLRDAVDYSFPTNTTMAAGERILVVSFSPTNAAAVNAFRAKYNLKPSIRLFGPYTGRLSNAGESVELVQPDLVRFYATNIVVTGILVDKVEYQDFAPWPVAADGIGPALNRIVSTDYGNDVTNWVASLPTPGAGYAGGAAPVIASQPTSRTNVTDTVATFSVVATGPEPLSYQWRYNNANLFGATNATLEINGVQATQAGTYQVVVMNPANAVASDIVSLTVMVPVSVVQHPQSVAVKPGTNVLFTVFGTGSSPISYQWRFNGVPIPGANGLSYAISNVQRQHDGIYDVVVSNPVGPAVSDPARLMVLINPVILSFSTNYSAVQGGKVTFSIGVDGSLPMYYRWRSNNASFLPVQALNSYQSFLTLSNVQPNFGGSTVRYTVVLTNAAYSTPGVLSPNAFLTVLTDTDGDGLPDTWEAQYPTAGDPNADTDGDGMTNGEEYTAGTNPTDPLSYLRIEELSYGSGANIVFLAVSNKTYTLQFKNSLEEASWTRLADVVANPTNCTQVVTDPHGSSQRYYRLATPRLP